MAILIIAEHDDAALKPATLNAVAAAEAIGGEIHLLVAGGSPAAAEAGTKIAGVAKVLTAEGEQYAHGLAENLAALVVALAPGYSHILAP